MNVNKEKNVIDLVRFMVLQYFLILMAVCHGIKSTLLSNNVGGFSLIDPCDYLPFNTSLAKAQGV